MLFCAATAKELIRLPVLLGLLSGKRLERHFKLHHLLHAVSVPLVL